MVAERSDFVSGGLLEETPSSPTASDETAVQPGHVESNDNGSDSTSYSQSAVAHEDRLVSKRLTDFPLPHIDVLCQAFLTDVEAFATPSELAATIRAIEEFKRPGSTGRALYDRAAAKAADPDVGNWAFEPTLRRGFLDRRQPLVPCSSFWFSHPVSKLKHSQAERAALLSFTANNYRLRLDAGVVKPVVLNEQELTTAFHPWIFNTVRVPSAKSDEIKRHPRNDYCVVFWKGNAFKLCLSVGNKPATYGGLLASFKSIVEQPVERSSVGIFTSDSRKSWAEARQDLQKFDSQNAMSIEAIEAAAFIVSLDNASPTTAAQRGRQFHFGGEEDAANRWHDKSLQFVVCANGISGTLGEHTVLDALTLNELNDEIGTAIRNHRPNEMSNPQPSDTVIMPEPLPLCTDAALDARIDLVRIRFNDSIARAEHAYLLFEGYGSSFLRAHKLSPKSVFQMVVQLAAHSFYGYTPPCWETVNQAHYHLGRVDIIQVVTAPVAAFIAAARDPSVAMADRRGLLVAAIRAHVASITKAGKNLGWERNFGSLRALLEPGEDLPALFSDPVYMRVRPRVLMSNCFETGMLEKGCMWRNADAVWSHYEVYADSVYFSVVTAETGRATGFCEHLKTAAELVEQIVLA
ncbi:acyltransferase ChoActase/COT/CPT [Nemania sp. FL0916]|nr:acyltransferase ChoActase/COT/CPT [Nemania sp. FL0916]